MLGVDRVAGVARLRPPPAERSPPCGDLEGVDRRLDPSRVTPGSPIDHALPERAALLGQSVESLAARIRAGVPVLLGANGHRRPEMFRIDCGYSRLQPWRAGCAVDRLEVEFGSVVRMRTHLGGTHRMSAAIRFSLPCRSPPRQAEDGQPGPSVVMLMLLQAQIRSFSVSHGGIDAVVRCWPGESCLCSELASK